MHIIYKLNKNNGKTIYLPIWFKRGPPCPNSEKCLNMVWDSVEVDSTHKGMSKWGNGVVGMSSLRVMVSQGTHESIITIGRKSNV